MGSWVSHLPEELSFGEVIGHGLNGQELAANPRLSRHFGPKPQRQPARCPSKTGAWMRC